MCACEDLCATIYKKVRKYTQMEGAKGMTYMFYFTDDSVSYWNQPRKAPHFQFCPRLFVEVSPMYVYHFVYGNFYE